MKRFWTSENVVCNKCQKYETFVCTYRLIVQICNIFLVYIFFISPGAFPNQTWHRNRLCAWLINSDKRPTGLAWLLIVAGALFFWYSKQVIYMYCIVFPMHGINECTVSMNAWYQWMHGINECMVPMHAWYQWMHGIHECMVSMNAWYQWMHVINECT